MMENMKIVKMNCSFKKKKSNCMSFVKKRAEIIAGKRNKKK